MLTMEFMLTALVVVLIPGTGVIFTVTYALIQGRSAAFYAALGCTAGIVPHLLASIFGLAALLHVSAVAFTTLKYLGVLYLFYLAVVMWKDNQGFSFDGETEPGAGWRIAVWAMLANVLNPKLSIFFLAFLPQFISPVSSTPVTEMMVLSSVFMLMTFVVFLGYGLVASGFRNAVMRSERLQQRMKKMFAAAFAGLGVNLAMSER
ncbi:LysE family translocator [Parasalinivibrio latis]|uniref:LysE family translocator n=1 Tax=Parasalinivibrio latis TaxID=2952610 RepID=UPI0030E5BF3A